MQCGGSLQCGRNLTAKLWNSIFRIVPSLPKMFVFYPSSFTFISMPILTLTIPYLYQSLPQTYSAALCYYADLCFDSIQYILLLYSYFFILLHISSYPIYIRFLSSRRNPIPTGTFGFHQHTRSLSRFINMFLPFLSRVLRYTIFAANSMFLFLILHFENILSFHH